MQTDTRKLIIELLNAELKRANRLATLLYHREVKEAKDDFVRHIKALDARGAQ